MDGDDVEPVDPDVDEQLAQQRQRDPDDVVVVTLQTGDERAAEPVDGEGSGHPQRLARGDVGVDLLVGEFREVDLGRCGRPQGGLAACLLYTSDAADDLLCVDLGGRRIIKKKNI